MANRTDSEETTNLLEERSPYSSEMQSKILNFHVEDTNKYTNLNEEISKCEDECSKMENNDDNDDLSDVDFDEDTKCHSQKDLSDVSDEDSLIDNKMDVDSNALRKLKTNMEIRSSLNFAEKNPSKDTEMANDEDALDFEAEEGECSDIKDIEVNSQENLAPKLELSEPEDEVELEEGEVTDDDERRPEENEPKPVCRFYTRGQCTWGISCRFLHPGVTDKGNYTMFDLVRPVPSQTNFQHNQFEGYRDLRSHMQHVSPQQHSFYGAQANRSQSTIEINSESPWERGLRTAKEMMRKASKRKEQDIDFEDKKMNLSISQDEMEKDNYYTKDRSSPEVHSYDRQIIYTGAAHGQRVTNTSQNEDPFSRLSRHRFRELPSHRMPHYEDDGKRKHKSAREVIVQKADDWNDPWMRSKSPIRNTKRKSPGSYSSNSSYSSSTSSQSGSSSDSSRSPSPQKNRRYAKQKSDSEFSGPSKKYLKVVSSPRNRVSPGSKNEMQRRYDAKPLSPKRSDKGGSPKRKRTPVTRKTMSNSTKKRTESTTDTSGSSESDSESSGTSSSDSSASNTSKNIRTRDVALNERKTASKKVEMIKKKFSSLDETTNPTASLTTTKTNRREELLKQLKAVEDAIARKRSKIN